MSSASTRTRPEQDVLSSNSTANLFLGRARKTWMANGRSPTVNPPLLPQSRAGRPSDSHPVNANAPPANITLPPAQNNINNNNGLTSRAPTSVSISSDSALMSPITPGEALTQPPVAPSLPQDGTTDGGNHPDPHPTLPSPASSSHNTPTDVIAATIESQSRPAPAISPSLAVTDRQSATPQDSATGGETVSPGRLGRPRANSAERLIDRHFWSYTSRKLEEFNKQAQTISEHVDEPRIRLLQDACNEHDLLYLALHQIYCLQTRDPKKLRLITQTEPRTDGLEIIQTLLVDNHQLSEGVLKWVIKFPRDLSHMQAFPDYQAAMQLVLHSLGLLADRWDEFEAEVKTRGYPPLIDELVVRFRISSSVLLSIIFLSMCRRLYGPKNESQLRKLFDLNKQNYERRWLPNMQPPSTEQLERENEHLKREYLAIRTRSASDASSPSRAGNQGRTPSITQAGPPRNAKTTSLSSRNIPAVTGPAAYLNTHASRATTPQLNGTVARHLSQQQQNAAWLAAMRQSQYRPSFTVYGPQGANLSAIPHTREPIAGTFSGPGQRPPFNLPPNARFSPSMQFAPQMMNGARARTPQAATTLRGGPFLQGQVQQPLQQPTPQLRQQPRQQQPRQQQPHRPQLQQQQPHQQQQSFTTFLRQPGWIPPITARPNPLRLSLHQAHLRDPYKVLGSRQSGVEDLKLFQYLTSFALSPTPLGQNECAFHWNFSISGDDFKNLTRTYSHGVGQRGHRVYFEGCRTYHLRCIRVSPSTEQLGDHVWNVSDTAWPSVIYVFVNQKELFVRRKVHNGKDLPLDITDHLREGNNELSFHFIRNPAERKDALYALGIEAMDTTGPDQVEELIQQMPAADSRARIQKRMSPSTGDDELSIVSETLDVDLIDPFTTLIVTVPTRSVICRHVECFDLPSFLLTCVLKPGRGPAESTWKCPICGEDARPQCLIIDGFLATIRAEIQYKNLVHSATGIRIKSDGTWEIKFPQEPHAAGSGQPRVTPAKRSPEDSDPGSPRSAQRLKLEPSASMSPRRATKTQAPEVIELD